jgi:hypothetical protein
LAERPELDSDGEAALELGDEITRSGHVEGAGGDEEDVVGPHRAVAGVDHGALEQGQKIALDALAADIRTMVGRRSADLVDLVHEDDAVVLDIVDGVVVDAIHVDEAIGLLLGQGDAGVGHGHPLAALARRRHLREEVGQRVPHLLQPGAGEAFERRLVRLLDLDVDVGVLELLGPQPRDQPATQPLSLPPASVLARCRPRPRCGSR